MADNVHIPAQEARQLKRLKHAVLKTVFLKSAFHITQTGMPMTCTWRDILGGS